MRSVCAAASWSTPLESTYFPTAPERVIVYEPGATPSALNSSSIDEASSVSRIRNVTTESVAVSGRTCGPPTTWKSRATPPSRSPVQPSLPGVWSSSRSASVSSSSSGAVWIWNVR